jgi:hypothetical protein
VGPILAVLLACVKAKYLIRKLSNDSGTTTTATINTKTPAFLA